MSFAPYKPREPGSTKDVVSRLYGQAGGAKHVAFLLGYEGVTTAYRFTDPAEPKSQISFDEVRRVTVATGATAAAEALAADAGGVFLPVAPPDDGCIARLTEAVLREHGELVVRLFRDVADGRRSGADAVRELDESIRAQACLRAHLIAATPAPTPAVVGEGNVAHLDRPRVPRA